jgi:fructose-bisphosphate aldolase class I
LKEAAMNLAKLNQIAEAMVAPGRGILAADESSGTIKKRFDVIAPSRPPTTGATIGNCCFARPRRCRNTGPRW